MALATLSARCAFAADWSSADHGPDGRWNISGGSQISNNQTNLQTQWSNMTGTVDAIGGDAAFRGAAAGNLVDITTMNDTVVANRQIVGPNAAVGSNVDAGANNVWGSVGIQNQVVCNGASVSTDPVLTKVNSYQECQATDPTSAINAKATNIAGTLAIQGSALGNSLEADSNADRMPITTQQINNSIGASTVNASAYNIGGSMSLSSSAIGNAAQILHYSTKN
jgi:hypothetical protein